MSLIGRSPISIPAFVTSKVAALGCLVFPIAKRWNAVSVIFDSAVTATIGLTLFAAGILCVVVSLVHLGRSASVGLPKTPAALKTTGVYRFSRNPVYFGAFVACLGSNLYAVHPVNALLAAVAIVIHLRIVKAEERYLEGAYGTQWTEYARRVPRYVRLTYNARRTS